MIWEKIKNLLQRLKECLEKIAGRFYENDREEELLAMEYEGLSEMPLSEARGEHALSENEQPEIMDYIRDHVILVTGGGGSIGSELCRQVGLHHPRRLIIFDISENGAYDIQQELGIMMPDLDVVTIIGSVRDSARVNQVFSMHKPDIVFHSAAHKNLSLMENSPCEAVKNNVLGTLNAAVAAKNNGCRRFVLISDDKALNPTSIMGASKRLCEQIVQAMDILVKLDFPGFETPETTENGDFDLTNTKATEFAAVRLGNLIDSDGSDISLLRKQIAYGGPVTVSHPDAERYFITTSDAVGLILQAGAVVKGGEIFGLDMGEPVKTVDLARDLILQSGRDVEIKYSGLRPGEKLKEENLLAQEGIQKTIQDRIYICPDEAIDAEGFFHALYELKELARINSPRICEAVAEMIPSYRPAAFGEKTIDRPSIEIEPEIPELFADP